MQSSRKNRRYRSGSTVNEREGRVLASPFSIPAHRLSVGFSQTPAPPDCRQQTGQASRPLGHPGQHYTDPVPATKYPIDGRQATAKRR
ncbi:hypothetical protein G6F68_021423 [Rhizopus microsporus]|nr:hypothetical protein G6F68_021423 [Rhizopus microsporus]